MKALYTHRFTLSAALLGVAGSALAEPPGLYLGAAVGRTGMDLSAADTADRLASQGFANRTSVADDADTGFRVYAGYQFNPYLAAEAAYVDLGEGRIHGELQVTPATAVDTRLEVHGYSIGLKAGFPATGELSLHAKLGLFLWDAKANANAVNALGAFSSSRGDDGSDLAYGLGLAYAVGDHVALRLDWDRYGVGGGANADTDLFALGVQYHF